MDKMVKLYLMNKIVEFIKEKIYRSEIINKGKSGVEKFNAVVENFWDNLENYIKKEKEIDRKLIPNFIEELAEETAYKVIKTLRNELNIKKLVQDIFDFEKKENEDIF